MHKSYNLCSTVKILTTCDCPTVIDAKATHSLKIVIFVAVRGSLLEYCHNVWFEKLEWCGWLTVNLRV